MSPYILIQGSLPPILLTISIQTGDQGSAKSVVERGGTCVIEWRKPRAGDEESRWGGGAFDGDSSGDEEDPNSRLTIQRVISTPLVIIIPIPFKNDANTCIERLRDVVQA